MSTISWNCRGLGNPRAIRALKDIVSDKKPSFIFLIETKIKQSSVLKVRKQLGFKGSFVVDPVGIGGGLALFWKDVGMAKLISYSQHHIDVEVCIEGMASWRLTGFYGFPNRAQRSQGWDLLRSLRSKSVLPWCVLGDFNDILYHSEK